MQFVQQRKSFAWVIWVCDEISKAVENDGMDAATRIVCAFQLEKQRGLPVFEREAGDGIATQPRRRLTAACAVQDKADQTVVISAALFGVEMDHSMPSWILGNNAQGVARRIHRRGKKTAD